MSTHPSRRRPGRRRVRLVAPALALAGALALAAPLLGRPPWEALSGGASCWELRVTRVLVNDVPVSAVGTRCERSRYGTWSWRGLAASPDGEITYRWREELTPDGRPHRLRFTTLAGPPIAALARELPGARVQLLGHLNLIEVRERGGRLRYSLHGERRQLLPFHPTRSS